MEKSIPEYNTNLIIKINMEAIMVVNYNSLN